MLINWNEVDKAKLEYIQKQEAAEAKYRKEYRAYLDKKNKQSFLCQLFNCLEEPEYPYLPNFKPYIYNISNSFYIGIGIDSIIITDPNNCLESKYADQIIKYLDLDKSNKVPNCKEYHLLEDVEENRKKVDKVVALVEKYIGKKQKEAETYIDNYINNKEGK